MIIKILIDFHILFQTIFKQTSLPLVNSQVFDLNFNHFTTFGHSIVVIRISHS